MHFLTTNLSGILQSKGDAHSTELLQVKTMHSLVYVTVLLLLRICMFSSLIKSCFEQITVILLQNVFKRCVDSGEKVKKRL